MSKFKNRLNFFKKLFKSNEYEWIIAIRKKQDKLLFEDDSIFSAPFNIVKNNRRFWRADPFFFSYNKKDYLFAEMYDRKKKKGVIGVARVRKGFKLHFKTILEEKYHLSYPCVFEWKGQIYLLPECESMNLILYRFIQFPYKWEKIILLNQRVADTTPIFMHDKLYFVTTLLDETNQYHDNLQLYEYTNDTLKHICPLAQGTSCSRSAGHIIDKNTYFIRPAQDCSITYGGQIKFFACTLTPKTKKYNQNLIKTISPDDIKCNIHSKFYGVHTYNVSDKYEVIDLKYYMNKNSFYAFKQNFQNYRKTKKASK